MIRRGLAVLIASAGLAGCSSGYSVEPWGVRYGAAPPPQAQPVVDNDPNVGTTRWTLIDQQICDAPFDAMSPQPQKCFSYAGEMKVLRHIKGQYGIDNGYEVEIKGKRTGFVNSLVMTDDEDAHKKRLADKAACDRKGGVRIGMSRDQVYASCWGKPERINATVTGSGKHEQLVYGLSNYVYLDNGVVTSIQTRER